MKTETDTWFCSECYYKAMGSDLLKAKNPFCPDKAMGSYHPDKEITGCPYCKSVETMVQVCDEPGCWDEATHGWRSEEGYRRTCGAHTK